MYSAVHCAAVTLIVLAPPSCGLMLAMLTEAQLQSAAPACNVPLNTIKLPASTTGAVDVVDVVATVLSVVVVVAVVMTHDVGGTTITVIEYAAAVKENVAPTLMLLVAMSVAGKPWPRLAAVSCGTPYVYTVATDRGVKPASEMLTSCAPLGGGLLLMTMMDSAPFRRRTAHTPSRDVD